MAGRFFQTDPLPRGRGSKPGHARRGSGKTAFAQPTAASGSFGVGGAIANAPVIDFGMDIVEIGGKPKAKRGKRSGVKQVWEQVSGEHVTLPVSRPGPEKAVPLLTRFIENGRIVQKSGMEAARERVVERLSLLKIE